MIWCESLVIHRLCGIYILRTYLRTCMEVSCCTSVFLEIVYMYDKVMILPPEVQMLQLSPLPKLNGQEMNWHKLVVFLLQEMTLS